MKQVKLLLLAVVVVLFFQCKSNYHPQTDGDIQGTHLDVKGAIEYLPKEYLANISALYLDSEGNKKVINTHFFKKEVGNEISGQSYTSDQVDLNLTDSTDINFYIRVSCFANYYIDYQKVLGVSIEILPNTPDWTVGIIGVDEDGKAIGDQNCDYQDTLLANGKTFKEIYMIRGVKSDSFSEFYFNTDFGLVQFRDRKNTLFTFDKFL